jgi:hypothetical protein
MDNERTIMISFGTIITILLLILCYLIGVVVTTHDYTETVEVTNANLYNTGIRVYTNSSVYSIVYIGDQKASTTLIFELNNFDYENSSCYLQLTWNYRSGIFSKIFKTDLRRVEML